MSYQDNWKNCDTYPPGASRSRIVTRSQTSFIRIDMTPDKLDLFADKKRHQPFGLPHLMTFMKGKNGSIPRTVITRSLGKQLEQSKKLEEGLQAYLRKLPKVEEEKTKVAKKEVKKDRGKQREVKDEKERPKEEKEKQKEQRRKQKEEKEMQKEVKDKQKEDKEKLIGVKQEVKEVIEEPKEMKRELKDGKEVLTGVKEEQEEETDKPKKKHWYSLFWPSAKSPKREIKVKEDRKDGEDKKEGDEQEEYDDGDVKKSVTYFKPYIRALA